jgi:hypothetical protein
MVNGTEGAIVLVALGLCALIVAGYYQPFEVHEGFGRFEYPATVYCSLQTWWLPQCRGRAYAAILEILAVVAFAGAGRAYLKRSRS